MSAAAYFPVLLQIVLAAVLAGVILGDRRIFGHRGRRNAIQDEPYECGLAPEGESHPRFSVKFYVTAMLFILLDIEVVFLIPWVFIYRDFLANHVAILSPVLFFLGLLVLGLFYEVKKGALDWEK